MNALSDLARRTMEAARARNVSIITAESCTAGKLSGLLSEVPGAGAHLHGGFVTYTKAHKTEALGVPADLLKLKGAVCAEVTDAMAQGALTRSPADIAVAITGVAGPEPDEDGNPVGLACIALARHGEESIHLERCYGDIGRDHRDRDLRQGTDELVERDQRVQPYGRALMRDERCGSLS